MMNENNKRIFIIIAVCFFVVLSTSTALKGIPGAGDVGVVAIGIMAFISFLLVITSPKQQRERGYPSGGSGYPSGDIYESEYEKERDRLEAKKDFYNEQRRIREREELEDKFLSDRPSSNKSSFDFWGRNDKRKSSSSFDFWGRNDKRKRNKNNPFRL